VYILDVGTKLFKTNGHGKPRLSDEPYALYRKTVASTRQTTLKTLLLLGKKCDKILNNPTLVECVDGYVVPEGVVLFPSTEESSLGPPEIQFANPKKRKDLSSIVLMTLKVRFLPHTIEVSQVVE
jgi:hypothetical protein